MTLNEDGLDGAGINSITLTDISREGLMASDAGQLLPGTRVLLEVPLIGWREAEVMWIAENRAGCRFDEPLGLEELQLAAASSERLAAEFPGFATAIAGLALSEDVASAAEPVENDSGGRWPHLALIVLAALVLVSFLITMILLNQFDL